TFNLQQQTTYLDLIKILLDAKADPNVRLNRSLWYTTYNRDNLRVDFRGATPFWRAAYATDVAAMKLLLAYGAKPDIPTIKPAARQRGGGRGAPAPTTGSGYPNDAAERGGGGGGGRADASGLPPIPEG